MASCGAFVTVRGSGADFVRTVGRPRRDRQVNKRQRQARRRGR